MHKIRVLIVDDSVVIRRLLADCLAGDPALEVAATAASGAIALAKIPQLNPDVVTLDVEMPDMDGIQTLIEIRKTHPRLPVIMFSTLTERGAASTLDALTHGASDYVTKPSGSGGLQSALQHVRDDLVPRIKAMCAAQLAEDAPAAMRPAPSIAVRGAVPAVRPAVVAIGVSTGGPNALATLVPELPPDFPAPVVIVQHMPPLFTVLLAERLSAAARLPVREASGGELLEPGQIWLAPGDQHLAVVRATGGVRLALHREPHENSCRPAVDVLFRSVATVYGARALAVVLTGMGQDGLTGARWIKEHGGTVLVQDEPTSVVWGMPGYVARAGLADEMLPLDMIAPAIIRLAGARPSANHVRSAAGAER